MINGRLKEKKNNPQTHENNTSDICLRTALSYTCGLGYTRDLASDGGGGAGGGGHGDIGVGVV